MVTVEGSAKSGVIYHGSPLNYTHYSSLKNFQFPYTHYTQLHSITPITHHSKTLPLNYLSSPYALDHIRPPLHMHQTTSDLLLVLFTGCFFSSLVPHGQPEHDLHASHRKDHEGSGCSMFIGVTVMFLMIHFKFSFARKDMDFCSWVGLVCFTFKVL